MRLDIVTPEHQLLSEDVTAVQLPGMEGDMTVMENHAPLVTTLRPGILKVEGGSGGEYVILGGFAEISAEGASVLAEKALPRAEVTREVLDAQLAEVRATLEISEGNAATIAAQRINDLGELINQIG